MEIPQHTTSPHLINSTTDTNDHKVYTYMRSLVISGIFFLVLYIFSHFSLRRYFRKRIEYDEFERTYLPFVLCSFCFSISLGAMLLMPITIVSNEILLSFPNNYYLLWLDRTLIFELWNWIYWGVNISLFFILPFSYFLYEAEGFGGKSLFARFQEAALVLSLVSIIFGGFVFIIHLIVSESNESFDYVPFSYTIISTAGSLIVLLCTPRGFTTLTTMGLQLYMPFSSRQTLNDRLNAVELEEQVILSKFNEKGDIPEKSPIHSHYTTINMQEQENLSLRLSIVREEKNKLKGRLAQSAIIRNLLSLVITLINFACTGYVVLRVLFHLITRFIDPSASSKLIDFLNLEVAADLVVDRVEAFIQTAVIIYMMAAAFMGFYSLNFMDKIRPRKGNTSMGKLVFNTATILLISSSFPVVARILEITSFDLMGNFRHTKYLVHGGYLYFYKISFMVTLAHRFLNLLLHSFSVQINPRKFHFYIQPKRPTYSPLGKSNLSRSSSFDFFDQNKPSLLPFSLHKPAFKND